MDSLAVFLNPDKELANKDEIPLPTDPKARRLVLTRRRVARWRARQRSAALQARQRSVTDQTAQRYSLDSAALQARQGSVTDQTAQPRRGRYRFTVADREKSAKTRRNTCGRYREQARQAACLRWERVRGAENPASTPAPVVASLADLLGTNKLPVISLADFLGTNKLPVVVGVEESVHVVKS